MVIFDPSRQRQTTTFEAELVRLASLVADMERIERGTPPEDLAGEATILNRWTIGQRPVPCLLGLATDHPILVGTNRAIATSDIWLMSEDQQWARTRSRWYRLGRPAGTGRGDA